MSSLPRTLHVLTPTFKPVGGVVKIMDYASHAQSMGYRISLWCPSDYSPDLPLFNFERFRSLDPTSGSVDIHAERVLTVGPDDLVFLSLPSNFAVAHRSLPPGMSPERIIHIIQNVRHVTPTWGRGQPLRLLTRPMARISTNDIVHGAIAPYLDSRALHRVIPLGHDLGYFYEEREGGLHRPVRVAYTTWKSDVGDRVAASMDPKGFTFRAIREHVTWEDLRELYRWADVFLCAPNLEEGFYMPGLEAMESGALVITPDVGGNMAYCRPGENCVLVDFEDADDYVRALRDITTWPIEKIDAFRTGGRAACAPFDLDREREQFGDFLDDLWPRIRAFERGEWDRDTGTRDRGSSSLSPSAGPAAGPGEM